jgi:hypothetical protein
MDNLNLDLIGLLSLMACPQLYPQEDKSYETSFAGKPVRVTDHRKQAN